MTNNDRESALYALGYSTREVEETLEAESKNATGTHFANALAFIVESLTDEGTPISEFGTGYFHGMDSTDLMEFATMYNFTEEAFRKALTAYQLSVLYETAAGEGH